MKLSSSQYRMLEDLRWLPPKTRATIGGRERQTAESLVRCGLLGERRGKKQKGKYFLTVEGAAVVRSRDAVLEAEHRARVEEQCTCEPQPVDALRGRHHQGCPAVYPR